MIPNPMDTLEQYDQFHHLDIEHLSDEVLRTELYRRRGVIWERPELSKSWLQERVEMLEEELKRRWFSKKYGATMDSNSTQVNARTTGIKKPVGVRL